MSRDQCGECRRVGGTCIGRSVGGRGESSLGQRGTFQIRSMLMVYVVGRQFLCVSWVGEVDGREW